MSKSESRKLPLVSIVIPMYNSSKFIEEMLDSISKQTYKEYEVIIVDDDSKDNSCHIVKQYVDKDSRFQLHKRPNTLTKGANSCRNYGLSKVKGKYIIFADSDDFFAPYALHNRLEFMESNEQLDFGIFPAMSFDEDTNCFNSLYYGYKQNDKTLNNLINKCLPFITWCLIFRKDSLKTNNITWDENLLSNQDADFNITCISKGLNFEYSYSDPDYFWRQVKTSIWHKMVLPEQANSHIYYLNKIYNNYKDQKIFYYDLKMLSLWLFKKLINNNKEIINKYLSLTFFENNKFLKYKYRILYYISKKLYNRFKLEYLFLFFFPLLSLKDRYNEELKPFSKKRKKNFKLLYNKISTKFNSKIKYDENIL